jgi:hypothetical protein
MSTHTPAQRVVPRPQFIWQRPALQTEPDAQAIPQAPQFMGSLCSETHAPEQTL